MSSFPSLKNKRLDLIAARTARCKGSARRAGARALPTLLSEDVCDASPKPCKPQAKRPKAPPKPKPLTTADVAVLLRTMQIPMVDLDAVTFASSYQHFLTTTAVAVPPRYGQVPLPFTIESLAQSPNLFQGLVVSCTGTLDFLERSDVASIVRTLGGVSQKTTGKRTNLLLVGTECGPSKIATARAANICCIDDAAFVRLIEAMLSTLHPTSPRAPPSPEFFEEDPDSGSDGGN